MAANGCRSSLKWKATLFCTFWFMLWFSVTRNMPDTSFENWPLESQERKDFKETSPKKMELENKPSPIDLKTRAVEQPQRAPVLLKPNPRLLQSPNILRPNNRPSLTFEQRLARLKMPFDPSNVDYSKDNSYLIKLEQMQREIFESLVDNNVTSLLKLSDEKIGPFEEPARFNVLLATQRTGSTFIGSILAAHPATFYHYEPTNFLGLKQAREGALLKQAEDIMKQLIWCNVSEDYIKTSRRESFGLQQNDAWKTFCGKERYEPASDHWCWSREVLRHLCRIYPVHFVKSNGVRLHALLPLIKVSPYVNVLVTARDPRAIKHSRKAPAFCKGRPMAECDDPALCSDMVRDYHTAVLYADMFPLRVRVVRLEDINKNPMTAFKSITNFFGLHFTKTMKDLVTNSTNVSSHNDQPSLWSTKRDPMFEEMQWRQELPWEDIVEIQDDCREAMKLWGYNTVTHKEQLATFEAVGNLKFDLHNV